MSITTKLAPQYPSTALIRGIGGNVVMLIDVDAQGKPVDVQVEHSDPGGIFDAVSIDAARRWTYQAAIENGNAVASQARVPVTFVPSKR